MPKRGVLIFGATCIFTKSYRTLSKINKVNKKRQLTLAGEKCYLVTVLVCKKEAL